MRNISAGILLFALCAFGQVQLAPPVGEPQHKLPPAPKEPPPQPPLPPETKVAPKKKQTASAPANKKPEPKLARPSRANAQPKGNKLPEGAVRINQTTWRYTDASGKSWLYYQTPFGYSVQSEKAASVTSAPPKGTKTSFTDLGDSIRFEKPSPFGKQTWTRKKSALSDEEKAIVGEAPAPEAGN